MTREVKMEGFRKELWKPKKETLERSKGTEKP